MRKTMKMRRIGWMLAALLCAASMALGEEEARLPQAVVVLCEQAYPGVKIAAFDGWGDEERGQYALILSQDGKNTLCIAEREEGAAGYVFTVENANAVRDGEEIPGVLIDTGGDALFLSYRDVNERGAWNAHEEYICFKGEDGAWGNVSTICYEGASEGAQEIVSYGASVHDGALRYERVIEDENENILRRNDYAPIPVSEAFAAGMRLENFDIASFSANPTVGLPGADGLAEGLMGEGDRLIELDVQQGWLVLLVEKPVGVRRLRVADWDGAQYTVRETDDLPEGAGLDVFHAGEGKIMIAFGEGGAEAIASFSRSGERWLLSNMMGGNVFSLTADSVIAETSIGRNDGAVYGKHPWGDLFTADFSSLPLTFEEAVARMDTSGYAFVNNPNPEDRLHLRTRASRSSASLGKFYNRTPVQVLSRDGEWAKVRIGLGEASLEGYMMTEYLAFGEEMGSVGCAFPQLQLREDLDGQGAPMRAKAESGAKTIDGGFVYRGEDYIIGVVGDDWYVVMRADGSVGYVRQSFFAEGNG